MLYITKRRKRENQNSVPLVFPNNMYNRPIHSFFWGGNLAFSTKGFLSNMVESLLISRIDGGIGVSEN
jgi:hypothetical protein